MGVPDFEKTRRLAESLLGPRGQILGSRVLYRESHPRDVIIFNASVGVFGLGVVWAGDLNVSQSAASLRSLAAHTKNEVWVHTEARAANVADAARSTGAVARFSSAGAVSTDPHYGRLSGGHITSTRSLS